jgi:carboxyl-terminal processing protease
LTAANVTRTPVQGRPSAIGNVGYLLFNDHISTSEAQLVDAVNTLKGG